MHPGLAQRCKDLAKWHQDFSALSWQQWWIEWEIELIPVSHLDLRESVLSSDYWVWWCSLSSNFFYYSPALSVYSSVEEMFQKKIIFDRVFFNDRCIKGWSHDSCPDLVGHDLCPRTLAQLHPALDREECLLFGWQHWRHIVARVGWDDHHTWGALPKAHLHHPLCHISVSSLQTQFIQ